MNPFTNPQTTPSQPILNPNSEQEQTHHNDVPNFGDAQSQQSRQSQQSQQQHQHHHQQHHHQPQPHQVSSRPSSSSMIIQGSSMRAISDSSHHSQYNSSSRVPIHHNNNHNSAFSNSNQVMLDHHKIPPNINSNNNSDKNSNVNNNSNNNNNNTNTNSEQFDQFNDVFQEDLIFSKQPKKQRRGLTSNQDQNDNSRRSLRKMSSLPVNFDNSNSIGIGIEFSNNLSFFTPKSNPVGDENFVDNYFSEKNDQNIHQNNTVSPNHDNNTPLAITPFMGSDDSQRFVHLGGSEDENNMNTKNVHFSNFQNTPQQNGQHGQIFDSFSPFPVPNSPLSTPHGVQNRPRTSHMSYKDYPHPHTMMVSASYSAKISNNASIGNNNNQNSNNSNNNNNNNNHFSTQKHSIVSQSQSGQFGIKSGTPGVSRISSLPISASSREEDNMQLKNSQTSSHSSKNSQNTNQINRINQINQTKQQSSTDLSRNPIDLAQNSDSFYEPRHTFHTDPNYDEFRDSLQSTSTFMSNNNSFYRTNSTQLQINSNYNNNNNFSSRMSNNSVHNLNRNNDNHNRHNHHNHNNNNPMTLNNITTLSQKIGSIPQNDVEIDNFDDLNSGREAFTSFDGLIQQVNNFNDDNNRHTGNYNILYPALPNGKNEQQNNPNNQNNQNNVQNTQTTTHFNRDNRSTSQNQPSQINSLNSTAISFTIHSHIDLADISEQINSFQPRDDPMSQNYKDQNYNKMYKQPPSSPSSNLLGLSSVPVTLDSPVMRPSGVYAPALTHKSLRDYYGDDWHSSASAHSGSFSEQVILKKEIMVVYLKYMYLGTFDIIDVDIDSDSDDDEYDDCDEKIVKNSSTNIDNNNNSSIQNTNLNLITNSNNNNTNNFTKFELTSFGPAEFSSLSELVKFSKRLNRALNERLCIQTTESKIIFEKLNQYDIFGFISDKILQLRDKDQIFEPFGTKNSILKPTNRSLQQSSSPKSPPIPITIPNPLHKYGLILIPLEIFSNLSPNCRNNYNDKNNNNNFSRNVSFFLTYYSQNCASSNPPLPSASTMYVPLGPLDLDYDPVPLGPLDLEQGQSACRHCSDLIPSSSQGCPCLQNVSPPSHMVFPYQALPSPRNYDYKHDKSHQNKSPVMSTKIHSTALSTRSISSVRRLERDLADISLEVSDGSKGKVIDGFKNNQSFFDQNNDRNKNNDIFDAQLMKYNMMNEVELIANLNLNNGGNNKNDNNNNLIETDLPQRDSQVFTCHSIHQPSTQLQQERDSISLTYNHQSQTRNSNNFSNFGQTHFGSNSSQNTVRTQPNLKMVTNKIYSYYNRDSMQLSNHTRGDISSANQDIDSLRFTQHSQQQENESFSQQFLANSSFGRFKNQSQTDSGKFPTSQTMNNLPQVTASTKPIFQQQFTQSGSTMVQTYNNGNNYPNSPTSQNNSNGSNGSNGSNNSNNYQNHSDNLSILNPPKNPKNNKNLTINTQFNSSPVTTTSPTNTASKYHPHDPNSPTHSSYIHYQDGLFQKSSQKRKALQVDPYFDQNSLTNGSVGSGIVSSLSNHNSTSSSQHTRQHYSNYHHGCALVKSPSANQFKQKNSFFNDDDIFAKNGLHGEIFPHHSNRSNNSNHVLKNDKKSNDFIDPKNKNEHIHYNYPPNGVNDVTARHHSNTVPYLSNQEILSNQRARLMESIPQGKKFNQLPTSRPNGMNIECHDEKRSGKRGQIDFRGGKSSKNDDDRVFDEKSGNFVGNFLKKFSKGKKSGSTDANEIDRHSSKKKRNNLNDINSSLANMSIEDSLNKE
jgi:hypothetical protein